MLIVLAAAIFFFSHSTDVLLFYFFMSEGSQLVINFTETLSRIVDSCRRTEDVRAIVFRVEIPAIEMPHNRRLVINQTSCVTA